MIPFLYSDLLKLVKSVLCLVLKPDVVNPCSSLTTLKKPDLTDKSNFRKAKDIKLGFGAKKCVDDLKNSDLVTNQGLKAYLNECITFVTTITSKLFDRSPLGSVIVRNADAYDPTAIASLEIDVLEVKVNRILMHLKLSLVSATYSDKALADCSSFFEQVKKMHVDQLKLFDSSKTDFDYFYFHELGKETKKHDKFAYVLKIILTLSHGQAAVASQQL